MKLMISTGTSSARCQWVMSLCQHSLGRSASKRVQLDRGRFCGCGVTNPLRRSARWMVDSDGGVRPACVMCHEMVAAPESSPSSLKCLRQATISSSSALEMMLAGILGSRLSGTSASSPPARQSATCRCTQDFDIPVAAATCRIERPSTTTAFTQYLARSMAPHHQRCPRNADSCCPRNPGTSDHRLHFVIALTTFSLVRRRFLEERSCLEDVIHEFGGPTALELAWLTREEPCAPRKGVRT